MVGENKLQRLKLRFFKTYISQSGKILIC